MSATIFSPPITPTTTAFSTVFVPQRPLPHIARRFANGTFTTAFSTSLSAEGPGCSSFNGFQTCTANGDYGNCLASTEAAACNCNYGMQYLGCVSGAIAASTCAGAAGINDWDAYERSWFQSLCPTPPNTVMTQLAQPSTVAVEYESIEFVTPQGPITDPPRPIATPNPPNDGKLLAGECETTSYTLLNAEDMVIYAPMIGCNADRPQCCPFNVSAAEAPGGNRIVAAGPGELPVPASNAKDRLDKCPQDYYRVSGLCCPNGYFKFTRQVAFQTPCFSYLSETANPPPITLGLAKNPTETSLPTSAIVNLIWAMSFNVTQEEQPRALSTGAVVGIGVGTGIAAILAVTAIAFLILRWRRNKKKVSEAQLGGLEDTQQQGVTYQSGYHAPQDNRIVEEHHSHGGLRDTQHHQGMAYHSGYHAPQGSSPPVAMKAAYAGTGGGAWEPGYAYRSQGIGYEGYSRT
ncbi:hypothetical protein N657DRAFT_637920 [Parathielavia appendiculata]|uniref:Uncharacterized protein n=1 Tax=Parathielavia appendiculata TaxID=2587402 RepID=A0AAN6TR34_9PEZI|nr:hypothetical protein N657DRAFT_637920 [Parathielavia appendiculata]